MPITSSQVLEDIAQLDGRRSVVVLHIDHLGNHYTVVALVPSGYDLEGNLSAKAAELLAHLKQSEINRATHGNPVVLPSFNTNTEFLQGWFAKLLASKKLEAVEMGIWMQDAITAGLVTVAQLKAIWGLTDPQWDAIAAKFQAWRDAWDEIENASGE